MNYGEVMLTEKRTKIVATIGPTSYDEDIMREMFRAGVNVARINFSHGDHETHANAIAQVRRIAQEENVVVAILGDLQGPKIRLGKFEESMRMVKGDELVLTTREDFDLAQREIPLPHPELVDDVQPGQRLLLDDGEIELYVLEKPVSTDLVCKSVTGGTLKQRKGVSAPDSQLRMSALTPKDHEDLKFAIEQNVDWIAMSFVRNADEVRELRALIRVQNGDLPIIAKIEKPEAIKNIEEIAQVSNAVMVARGDLGVETNPASVPIYQKEIIRLCNKLGKPVITATQMLDSMIRNPRPTRAEASDVANAIFDGTDAVMLSGESASGGYPVEAVQMMATIASIAERQLMEYGKDHLRNILRSYDTESDAHQFRDDSSTADAVSHATIEVAEAIGAKVIVCSTWTGYTARRISRERPGTPIVAITPNEKTYHRLSLSWGVDSLMVDEYATIDEMFATVRRALLENNYAKTGDRIVIISGVPFGVKGSTNFIKVDTL